MPFTHSEQGLGEHNLTHYLRNRIAIAPCDRAFRIQCCAKFDRLFLFSSNFNKWERLFIHIQHTLSPWILVMELAYWHWWPEITWLSENFLCLNFTMNVSKIKMDSFIYCSHHPPTKLREGNFSFVLCLSVCSQNGEVPSYILHWTSLYSPQVARLPPQQPSSQTSDLTVHGPPLIPISTFSFLH